MISMLFTDTINILNKLKPNYKFVIASLNQGAGAILTHHKIIQYFLTISDGYHWNGKQFHVGEIKEDFPDIDDDEIVFFDDCIDNIKNVESSKNTYNSY
jgi:hypothetical protein